MHLYIRHGNDENKHSTFKHDKSLNPLSSTEEDIIKFTQKLIKEYGAPDRIYCSPFKRARATLAIMLKVLDKTKIVIEPRLSRFFSKKEQQKISVRNQTLSYHPPIYEDKHSFHKRVDKIQHKIDCGCCYTWCITHYLVLKRIGDTKNIPIPSHMKFLWYTPV